MTLETQSDARTEFAKELGLKEAISIAVGAMIGGGIFSALGRLAHITGPSAVISFLLGGIIAFLTSNSYYRLVNKYPSAGGEFVILRRGFSNPLIGNSIGAMLWLGYSVTIALYAFTFGNYTSEFIHGLTEVAFWDIQSTSLINGRKLMSLLSILIFMMINLKGVKETGTVQNVIVLFKILVLLFVGILGFALFKPGRYDPFTVSQDAFIKTLGSFSGVGGIIIGASVIFVSYEGFQVIANTVEEMKNPARDVKIGMYISVITVTITYMVVTIATFSLVKSTADITETALIEAVTFLGTWAILLVTLGAAASTTSAINATLLGSSRLAYVMSDWAAFPKRLAVISKRTQVPYLAIIITSAISWLFTFFGNASEIAEVGSIIFLGIFLSINVSIMKIFPEENNMIAKIASILISIFMILVIIFFITHLKESALALIVLGVFSVITIVWMGINQRISKDTSIDTTHYELEPLGIEMIKQFKPVRRPNVDEFFVHLDKILVPVSGSRFEMQTWLVTARIARKYNAEIQILHVGKDENTINEAKEIYDRYNVSYNVKVSDSLDVATAIITLFREKNDIDLICLSSRRRESLIDRIFDKSVSKRVVDNVACAVFQIHPPAYRQKEEEIDELFLLFDGTERDVFLARWARLLSVPGLNSKAYVYHMIELPNTISPEDASKIPRLQANGKEFDTYAREICTQAGFENVEPVLLYGHNLVKSIYEQTEKIEPDAVFIGHTRDPGFFNQIRTHLAYRLINKLKCTLMVYHMAKAEFNIINQKSKY